MNTAEEKLDWSGIRTHAPEEIGALIQRLRPLGHPVLTTINFQWYMKKIFIHLFLNFKKGAWRGTLSLSDYRISLPKKVY